MLYRILSSQFVINRFRCVMMSVLTKPYRVDCFLTDYKKQLSRRPNFLDVVTVLKFRERLAWESASVRMLKT